MANSTASNPGPSRRGKILTTGLIILGLILVIFFGLRAVRSFIRLQQDGLKPGVTDVEQVKGWMTVPYIAHAYKVPEDYIFEQLNIPPQANRKKNLGQLNREFFPEERGATLNAVKAAIRHYQAEHPPGTTP
jgi:hypothetical protein